MIDATLVLLTQIFATHQTIVLWLSGGKDSLSLLHLCRPWADTLIILHNAVDTGFEGNGENLKQCVEAWGFHPIVETTPDLDFDAYVERYGWPVEIVPSAMDGILQTPYRGPLKVSSWWACTAIRQINPLMRATQALHADAILTGSRRSDAPFFETGGMMVDGRQDLGWIRYNPLHNWTTAEVWAYVEAQQIPLPPHYGWKREAAFEAPDCRWCTWQPEYLAWMKAHQPDEYKALMIRAGPTLQHLNASLTTYHDALDTLENTDHG